MNERKVNMASAAQQQFEQPEKQLSREERIRRRAYELFLHRGGEHGLEEQDWLQAESEEEPPIDQEPGVNGKAF
jgi:hypothetical protein